MGLSITAFEYDATRGALSEKQTISTVPENSSGGNSTAEIQVHPNGKFVYGSNRGHNSIATFSVDSKTGALTLLGNCSTEGKTPRHFIIDPTGHWLLAENQDSDSIVTLRIDQKTGGLTPTGQTVEVGSPVSPLEKLSNLCPTSQPRDPSCDLLFYWGCRRRRLLFLES
jgi:6-phosphogluconolactonase